MDLSSTTPDPWSIISRVYGSRRPPTPAPVEARQGSGSHSWVPVVTPVPHSGELGAESLSG